MDPQVMALFHELADRSPRERDEYYAQRRVPAAVRAEVESLLRFDRTSKSSLSPYVAAVAQNALLHPPSSDARIVRGMRLGPYEILAPLGQGGMGEVYRARDDRLARDVAVKVLRDSLTAELLARFEREARAAGLLSHPNVLSIYDFGTHEGRPYLVTELLEGETLRSRLGGRALSPRKAVDYALQIANGLAAAHGKGIVHRDLKPENVIVTGEGRIKILDFGLARMEAATDARSEAPTTDKGTEPGVVVGTVGYMSPEQVRGERAGPTSDIFALGTILYEMLSGERPFHRPTAAETMTAILHVDPRPLDQKDPEIPPSVSRLVARCLEKRPDERFQSARDIAFALEELSGTRDGRTPSPAAPRKLDRHAVWIGAALAAFALSAAIGFNLYRSSAGDQSLKLFVLPPEHNTFMQFSLSPDGRHLAFGATDRSGRTHLWVRDLDSLEARALPGTEEAILPFWSPDGRFLGFFAEGKLKTIDVSGGPPQVLCDARAGRGGTWNKDGVILFTPVTMAPLYRVSASGGEPTPETELDGARNERTHRWPQFLPDGRHFLYSAEDGVFVSSLDSSESTLLLPGSSGAVFAPPGYLVFVRKDVLLSQAFDPLNLQLRGEPVHIADQLMDFEGAPPDFSVSESGVLAYRSGYTVTNDLAWFDRTGRKLGRLDGPPAIYRGPEISPDEKRVVADSTTGQRGADVWLFDLKRGVTSRFTFGGADGPVWSPDGKHIVFADRKGNLLRKLSTGAGSEELLLETGPVYPTDISPDGRALLHDRLDPQTQWDVWVMPLRGDQAPYPLRKSKANEARARFSPDGRWIAYDSDESGRNEVYVQSSSGAAGRWQISTTGGSQSRWRRDGKELFYLSRDSQIVSVAVEPGSPFEHGAEKVLFQARVSSWASRRHEYAVTADGQRFLITAPKEEAVSAPITVVVNWAEEISRNR